MKDEALTATCPSVDLAALQRPTPTVRHAGPRYGKWVIILAAGMALAVADYVVWQRTAREPRPSQARARVQRYLERKAYARNFKVQFPFPLQAELAKAAPVAVAGSAGGASAGQDFEKWRREYLQLKTSALALERQIDQKEAEVKARSREEQTRSTSSAAGAITNDRVLRLVGPMLGEGPASLEKEIAVARSEMRAKEQALIPVVRELRAIQERWLAEAEANGSASAKRTAQAGAQFMADLELEFGQAGSYGTMYRLVGQELWVASRLLASANPGHQRVGVTLALDASHHALDDVQDGWVAARICEGYIWPHLDLANDTNPDSVFNADNLLNECLAIFRRNLEVGNMAQVGERLIGRSGAGPRADGLRAQIAMTSEETGDLKQAARWWRQIQNTNAYRSRMRRLPELEQPLIRK